MIFFTVISFLFATYPF